MLFASCELAEQSGHDAGRQLLSELYREYTGNDLPEIRLSPRGKPYFAEGNLHFSISHTKHHAFCVLAARPIGLDAEEVDRDIDLRLAEKILSPAEYKEFSATEDKRRALLTFWVLKEAAAKATGEGLRGYPKHTDFTLSDPRVFFRDGCVLAIIQEEENAV